MPANVIVHLFKVNRHEGTLELPDVLQQIAGDPLNARSRMAKGSKVRAEILDRARNGHWYLDFVKFRLGQHGPGRVSDAEPLRGIDLEADETWGEDTAALYIPQSDYMLVQFNYIGVRSSAIAEYLSVYDNRAANVYSLDVHLDQEAERKYQRQRIVTKVEVGIDLTKMNAQDRDAGRSLQDIADLGTEYGGDRVYITIAAEARDKRRHLLPGIRGAIQRLRRAVPDDALIRAQTSGREAPDAPIETVDLIEQKLTYSEEVTLDGDGRVDFRVRRNVLRNAYTLWQGQVNRR
jgi:hypothetical protein